MANKDLIAIGKYLYGEFWQSQLARALNVNVRTVQRWVAGDVAIKESVADEIILMAANKTYQRYVEILSSLRPKPREVALDWTRQKSLSADVDLKIIKLLASMLESDGFIVEITIK